MKQRLSVIIVALLCSSSVILPKAKKKKCTDILNQDIGYPSSPNPATPACLVPLTRANLMNNLYYNAALEPTIAVSPTNANNVVVAWQQDCSAIINSFFILGSNWPAMDAGIGYSQDGGQTWNRTLVPFQKCNGGFTQGINGLSLAYSSNGSTVYLAAQYENTSQDTTTSNQSGIAVCNSADNGKTWSKPVSLASSPALLAFNNYINPQVTADLTLKKSAYVVWQSPSPNSISSSYTSFSSTTSGSSWSPSTVIYNPDIDLGQTGSSAQYPVIVSLPNNDLLCFVHRFFYPGIGPYINDVACIRSTDNGATWTAKALRIADIPLLTSTYTCPGQNTDLVNTQATINSFRVTVNPKNGNLYVVFPYVFGTGLPQIGISVSRDNGHTWSTPAQVNRTPSTAPNPQAFTASVAVTGKGLVGILYHDFRNSPAPCVLGNTNTDVWLATYQDLNSTSGGSTGIGLNYVNETRLSATSYIVENGPNYQSNFPDYATNGCFNSMVSQNNCFYAAYIQSFNGPFTPPQTILNNSLTGALFLDNNRRTAPFFSRITGN